MASLGDSNFISSSFPALLFPYRKRRGKKPTFTFFFGPLRNSPPPRSAEGEEEKTSGEKLFFRGVGNSRWVPQNKSWLLVEKEEGGGTYGREGGRKKLWCRKLDPPWVDFPATVFPVFPGSFHSLSRPPCVWETEGRKVLFIYLLVCLNSEWAPGEGKTCAWKSFTVRFQDLKKQRRFFLLGERERIEGMAIYLHWRS